MSVSYFVLITGWYDRCHAKIISPDHIISYTLWSKLSRQCESSLIAFSKMDCNGILLLSRDQKSLKLFPKWCCKKHKAHTHTHTHTHTQSLFVVVHNSCLWSSSTAQFSGTDFYKHCKSTEGCKCPIDIHCTEAVLHRARACLITIKQELWGTNLKRATLEPRSAERLLFWWLV